MAIKPTVQSVLAEAEKQRDLWLKDVGERIDNIVVDKLDRAITTITFDAVGIDTSWNGWKLKKYNPETGNDFPLSAIVKAKAIELTNQFVVQLTFPQLTKKEVDSLNKDLHDYYLEALRNEAKLIATTKAIADAQAFIESALELNLPSLEEYAQDWVSNRDW